MVWAQQTKDNMRKMMDTYGYDGSKETSDIKEECLNAILRSHNIDPDDLTEEWQKKWKQKVESFCYNENRPRMTPGDRDELEYWKSRVLALEKEMRKCDIMQ